MKEDIQDCPENKTIIFKCLECAWNELCDEDNYFNAYVKYEYKNEHHVLEYKKSNLIFDISQFHDPNTEDDLVHVVIEFNAEPKMFSSNYIDINPDSIKTYIKDWLRGQEYPFNSLYMINENGLYYGRKQQNI